MITSGTAYVVQYLFVTNNASYCHRGLDDVGTMHIPVVSLVSPSNHAHIVHRDGRITLAVYKASAKFPQEDERSFKVPLQLVQPPAATGINTRLTCA